ncbi:MAG TPA: hypothetical protein VMV27_05925 [Candidatus Binataceae bacterium]|nr:hypothetical protein [Candidatus Binataceae bacterium]
MNDGWVEIRESRAFGMIAREHRAAAMHLFAIVRGDEHEPARAWIECRKCAAIFELVGGAEWSIVEEDDEAVIRPDRGRHIAAAQA